MKMTDSVNNNKKILKHSKSYEQEINQTLVTGCTLYFPPVDTMKGENGDTNTTNFNALV